MRVALGSRGVPEPDGNDALESSVGLAVSTAIEPAPAGLAPGNGYWIDPPQGDEGGPRVAAARVAPSSNEESRRCVWSLPKAVHGSVWL